MDEPQSPRPSLIEYLGLTMLLAMLTAGVFAAVAPDSVLEPILRAALEAAGAT